MDFSQKLMSEYQKEANKKLSSVCRLLIVFCALMFICGLTGAFNMPPIGNFALLVGTIILFLPTILYDWCKFESDFIRYFVLILLVFMCGTLYSIFSYHVLILSALPIIVACLYRQKKWVIFTTGISIPVMILVHIVAFNMDSYREAKVEGGELVGSIDGIMDLVTVDLVPRIIQLLAIVIVAISITDCFNDLVKHLSENNNQMYRDQESLISALSTMIEMQSQETGQHVRRVSEYTKILCTALGVDETETWKIGMAAMMHDVGKIAVPREILEKPGKLTDEEFVIIKRHIFYGKEILEQYPGEIMQLSANIAYQHHEHYDGSGYMGLKGVEISREAQCVALADFFDALVSKRSYKEAWSPERARTEILNQKSKFFDPYLVNLFDIHFVDFLEVYRMYPDE